MKFEENWLRGFREVIQRCKQMDDRQRTTTDTGRQVIIIAHPEPSAHMS